MDIEKYMLPCMNKSIFGIECMGCGTQRAFLLLLNGDFVAAFYQFPAIYTTILFSGSVVFHFLDAKRNYTKWIIGLAIVNACIMIVAYFYKLVTL